MAGIMQPYHRPHYHGYPYHGYPYHGYPYHGYPYHGFCHTCCHPMSMCVCHIRQCRKEAKEITITRELSDASDATGVWQPYAGGRIKSPLFSVGVEARSDLNNNVISRSLRQAFANNNIELPDDASVSVEETGYMWRITDGDKTYTVKYQDNRLDVYDVPILTLTLPKTAFIGGGCCVYLSIEYMPVNNSSQGHVEVLVTDSEGTNLTWHKEFGPGTTYRIKEGIITTKPGAMLSLSGDNVTARVRWCEVFSC